MFIFKGSVGAPGANGVNGAKGDKVKLLIWLWMLGLLIPIIYTLFANKLIFFFSWLAQGSAGERGQPGRQGAKVNTS